MERGGKKKENLFQKNVHFNTFRDNWMNSMMFFFLLILHFEEEDQDFFPGISNIAIIFLRKSTSGKKNKTSIVFYKVFVKFSLSVMAVLIPSKSTAMSPTFLSQTENT